MSDCLMDGDCIQLIASLMRFPKKDRKEIFLCGLFYIHIKLMMYIYDVSFTHKNMTQNVSNKMFPTKNILYGFLSGHFTRLITRVNCRLPSPVTTRVK